MGATRHEQHHALAASDPKPASLAMKELRRVFRRREERSIYVGFRLSPPQSKLALILQRAAASSTISAVFTLFGIGVQICGYNKQDICSSCAKVSVATTTMTNERLIGANAKE